MSNTEIVRAWKDPEYRATLSQVPPLLIGSIELDDPYLSEHTFVSKVFASRRGEHTSVFNLPNSRVLRRMPDHLPLPPHRLAV
jgi:mersacidin/lichenicidin family type 2 lantibiotic